MYKNMQNLSTDRGGEMDIPHCWQSVEWYNLLWVRWYLPLWHVFLKCQMSVYFNLATSVLGINLLERTGIFLVALFVKAKSYKKFSVSVREKYIYIYIKLNSMHILEE